MSNLAIGFIGAGKLGGALAMALQARDYQVEAVASRSLASARQLAAAVPGCRPFEKASDLVRECDLVFITTPDDAIASVATSLRWRPGQGVVHCSAALSLEALEPAETRGAAVGSLHPLQTLSCIETAEEAGSRLSGITYMVDGEGWVAEFLQEAARRLGGRVIRLRPEDRVLYHASSVLSCGYLTALLKAATDIWREMGYSPQEARSALTPLVQATVANFGRVGPEESVTGPAVRGDVATVSKHLQDLERRMPRLVPLVCLLGLESLSLMPQSMDPQRGQELEALFRGYLREGLDRTSAAAIPGRLRRSQGR